MNVLITGATGFIGGALCRALAARGDHVFAFHRPTSNLRQLENLAIEHVIGDLSQPETVHAAVQGMDAVFHAAAWVGMNDPGRLYAINVEGTRTVVQASLQAGVKRLVYTSSVAALGIPTPGVPVLLDENHTWNFRPELFPYGYAKYLAELEVQKGVAQGLEAVIVNPSLVLGPGDLYRQSSSVVLKIASRKVGVIVDGGANVIHVDDVALGQIAAFEYGKIGERYILGGKNITYREMVTTIAQVTGVPAPTVVLPGRLVRALRGPAHLIERYMDLPVTTDVFVLAGRYLYYDTQKAREQLFLPEPRSLEQAAAEAFAWFSGKADPSG
jgi:dihydroflavonol-4-reductase